MSPMSDPTPLRALYDSVTEANDWSQRDVERRIKARGMQLSKSRISQIINAWPLESITSDKIHALAAGLAVSPDRVALAAVQSMGFKVGAVTMTPAEAISWDESLSDDTRQALLSILRAADERRRKA